MRTAFDPGCDLSAALTAWKSNLGHDNVLDSKEDCARYAATSSSSARLPAAIIFPAHEAHVAEIVAIARRYRIPLYPISKGQNWGYGDKCAVFEGQVIVDLGKMNRILEVNAELGYAVVEPGVTQEDLSQYLIKNRLPYWIDCTGAGPQSSLIGNNIERGFGHSRYGNRFSALSGMEVVLGTGEILRTGFWSYPQAKTAHLYPYGMGPYLDGMFTQSNFGIVTKLGIWLLAIPARVCGFVLRYDSEQDFLNTIDVLRALRMKNLFQGVPHAANDLRLMSSFSSFPSDGNSKRSRLTDDKRAALRRQYELDAWVVTGAFWGSSEEIEFRKQQLREALKNKKVRILFFPDWAYPYVYHLGQLLAQLNLFPNLVRKIKSGLALFNLFRGQPTLHFIKGSYWRKKSGIPKELKPDTDVAQDNVGVMWMAPILPLTQKDVSLAIEKIEAIFKKYDFDCQITVNLVTERATAAVITIAYDAENEDEVKRAKECYDEGLKLCFDLGYPLYRYSVEGMKFIWGQQSPYWQTVARLKSVLDPDGIIAPGRYDPML